MKYLVMQKMQWKHVMATIMTDIVCALNSQEAADRAATVAVAAMIETAVKAAVIVDRLQNDLNIVSWYLDYHRQVHGKT